MRITTPRTRAAAAMWMAPLVLTLAACNEGNAARGAAAAGPGASAAPGSYVLVTQTRPEAPEKFFPNERRLHAVCAAVAGKQNIAIKPFPTLAPGFVSERKTYASDGKRTIYREVGYTIDTRKAEARYGCDMRLISQLRVALISDGQERTADQDEDGKVVTSEPQEAAREPVRASLLDSYSTAKAVNGVKLKCNADNSCIVDPAQALVARGVRPVQAAWRNDDVRTYGTALILEPVSLAVGKPVDAALFALQPAP